MPTKRINQVISELSLPKKIIGAGSALMILGLFMPWYQDLDTFKTGAEFSGLSGPLYLLGFSLLALSIINIVFLVLNSAKKKVSFLPFKMSSFHLFVGLFSFYALLAVNSIYFHQSFGVNITLKQSRFGMFMAFVAASLLTIGGYLETRDKSVFLKEFQEETEDTFIKVPEKQEKPLGNLRKGSQEQPEPKKDDVTNIEPNIEQPEMQQTQFVDPAMDQLQKPVETVQEPAVEQYSQPSNAKPNYEQTPDQPVAGNESNQNPPQPFRTDL